MSRAKGSGIYAHLVKLRLSTAQKDFLDLFASELGITHVDALRFLLAAAMEQRHLSQLAAPVPPGTEIPIYGSPPPP